jgi:hypothetical protein
MSRLYISASGGTPNNNTNTSLNTGHQQDDNDVDVMKIDAANLQDVMQYTGFDLKHEAESMSSSTATFAQDMTGRPKEEDLRSLPSYYFNATRMRSILSHFCRQPTNGIAVTEVEERVMELLGLAIQARLRNILHLLVIISRHRVDYGRRLYKIKIENDPKKQFWLLERLRTNPPWKKPVLLDNGAGSSNSSSSIGTSNSTGELQQDAAIREHPLLSKESANVGAKKKAPPPPSTVKKEDQTNLKSKITNTAAMAAAGMKQRSWMTSATTNPLPMSINYDDDSTAVPGTTSSNPTTMEDSHHHQQQHFSDTINLANAPSSIPLTDADLAAQLRSRTINRHDFLSACEHDPKLRRSRLHIQLLDLAPLL